MTLTPFLEAPTMIQLHLLAAMIALLVGPFALFGRTSDRTHRTLGYTWVVAIVVLAFSGLGIPAHDLAMIGPFGPIHLASLFALWGVISGVRLARRGRIAEHRQTMKWTWFGTMGTAGLLTLLPGRTVNRMLFGEPSEAGWLVMAIGAIVLVMLWRRDRGRAIRRAAI